MAWQVIVDGADDQYLGAFDCGDLSVIGLRVGVMETLGEFPYLPTLVRAEQSPTLPTRWAAAGPVRFVVRRWNTSSIPPPLSSRAAAPRAPWLGPEF